FFSFLDTARIDFYTLSLHDALPIFAQRKVDGGVISFPNSLQAEKLGIKTLLDFADSGLDIPSTTVVASRKYSNSHREVVLRFLRSEEHTSELQSRFDLVCRLLLEKK